MPSNERVRQAVSALKNLKPRPVSTAAADLVRTTSLDAAGTSARPLPLVFEPVSPDVDICGWARECREAIAAALLKHGALLFRGSGIDTPELFERFAATVTTGLFDGNGEHPREGDSANVYTPVFYPNDKKLLWHNENSFNHEWPLHILFGCVTPALTGGETPIVDSRVVFERIRPEIREPFLEKGVMYRRNYSPYLGLDWRTVFRTDDRAEVEKHCRDAGFDLEWKSDGALRTQCVRPAAIRHPATGEWSWFNQAQHWHVSCLDRDVRESFHASFTADDLPRSCCYGDGTAISDAVMSEILDVYASAEVVFPWQRGDVLFLDNVLAAHARNPFTGKRRLLVALGAMTRFEPVASRP